jgi:NAD(P)-dependent dehydrogenase (short-subunit alcohol dehydrogenase family)
MKSFAELSDMTSRVALITGGAGHIGSAIAGALAEVGCAVVLADVDARVEETAAAIGKGHGVESAGWRGDLTDPAAVPQLVALVETRFQRLSVLVNCAAFVGTTNLSGWAVPFEQQSVETFSQALDANLTAAFHLTQACAPLLISSGHGSVINISSIYGLVGPDLRLYSGTSMGNPAAYAASKAGLLQLTRWLATVLAPRVRANSITPGGVFRQQAPAFVEQYEARTPLGRMATEEDLIGAAVYLASDLSSYVTGQNLIVDGGWTAW